MSKPDDNSTRHAAIASPRRRRRLILAILIVAMLLLVLALRMASRPERVSAFVLQKLGEATGLEITSSGRSEYRLRGTPQLVVRDVVAREPGSNTPILRAQRVLFALPWSTIRAKGDDLTITRIELDQPVFDLPAYQTWGDKRPPSPTRIPTLTDGLVIKDGTLINDDWRIEGLQMTADSLHPSRMLQLHVRGRYLDPPLSIPADLAIAISDPARLAQGKISGIASNGHLTFEGDDWRVPATVALSGPLQLMKDSVQIAPLKFGMSAQYQSGDTRTPFQLGLYGPMVFDDAVWTLAPAGVALQSGNSVPQQHLHGVMAVGRRLVLRLQGQMDEWPANWPALPPPISKSRTPISYALDYSGKIDLGDALGLRLHRDATRFDARMHVFDVLAWSGADANASPLPPLDGRLSTPQVQVSGATLHGVELEFDDPDIAPAQPK